LNAIRLLLSWIKRHWSWLKWAVAAALLSFLYFQNRDNFNRLANRLAEEGIDWFYFGVAFVLCSTAILLTNARWYLLVKAQDFPFRFSDALRLGFIGYLFTYLGPGTAGGDIVKAVMIAREQKSRRSIAAATVVLDRILGMLALFMVGAFASFYQPAALLDHPKIRLVVAVLWGGSLAGLIGMLVVLHPSVPRSRWLKRLVRIRFIGPIIGELTNALLLYQQKRRYLFAAVGISVLGHFCMLSCFFFCSLGLQIGEAAPGYWAHLLLIPGAELVGALFPTPGGMGALEAAVASCYSITAEALETTVTLKESQAAGAFTALGYRVITFVVAAIGVGYYRTARREISTVLEESARTESDQPTESQITVSNKLDADTVNATTDD
jgi:uncharacterized membrane protein YbhN (UPF0104 family)